MIEVILVQQGEPLDSKWRGNGKPKKLWTEHDSERMERVALGLFGVVREVDGVFTGPAIRTIQAAKAISRFFGRDFEIIESLSHASTEGYQALIPTRGRHIIIGQDPAIRRFVGEVCRISRDALEPLHRGGAISIKKNSSDCWQLSWMLQPRHLRSIGSSLLQYRESITQLSSMRSIIPF